MHQRAKNIWPFDIMYSLDRAGDFARLTPQKYSINPQIEQINPFYEKYKIMWMNCILLFLFKEHSLEIE